VRQLGAGPIRLCSSPARRLWLAANSPAAVAGPRRRQGELGAAAGQLYHRFCQPHGLPQQRCGHREQQDWSAAAPFGNCPQRRLELQAAAPGRVWSLKPPPCLAASSPPARPGNPDQRRPSARSRSAFLEGWRHGGLSTSSIQARFARGLRQAAACRRPDACRGPAVARWPPAKAGIFQERDWPRNCTLRPSWALRVGGAEGVAAGTPRRKRRLLAGAGAQGPGQAGSRTLAKWRE